MLVRYKTPSFWHEILEDGAFAPQSSGLTNSWWVVQAVSGAFAASARHVIASPAQVTCMWFQA